MEYIIRDIYLEKLKSRIGNGFVKVITGPRRSGKSWLLSRIFTDYLLSLGVGEDEIVQISFDLDDERNQSELLSGEALKKYLYSRITDSGKKYYVMLDEVQEVSDFERIVNGLAAKENVDVYVTGSNSRFLSSDINTLFRGRGDEVRVWPFCFREFIQERNEPVARLWKEYYTYGGMPALKGLRTSEQKITYLQRLWEKVYISDVVERNHIRDRAALEALTDALCSSIGSLSNPTRLSNTLKSVQQVNISSETVHSYLDYLGDAYLFEGARRYNIKGHRYLESIKKYYSVDVGLRNARLNFRQQEVTHLMENVIYNELRVRGYAVDVGLVESREMVAGKQTQKQYEVDFIVSDGMDKCYIQSAYRIDSEEKKSQEISSLRKIDDSFRKIVIVGDDIATYKDEHGITYMGLFDFLLNPSSISFEHAGV